MFVTFIGENFFFNILTFVFHYIFYLLLIHFFLPKISNINILSTKFQWNHRIDVNSKDFFHWANENQLEYSASFLSYSYNFYFFAIKIHPFPILISLSSRNFSWTASSTEATIFSQTSFNSVHISRPSHHLARNIRKRESVSDRPSLRVSLDHWLNFFPLASRVFILFSLLECRFHTSGWETRADFLVGLDFVFK